MDFHDRRIKRITWEYENYSLGEPALVIFHRKNEIHEFTISSIIIEDDELFLQFESPTGYSVINCNHQNLKAPAWKIFLGENARAEAEEEVIEKAKNKCSALSMNDFDWEADKLKEIE